eukprot:SM000370S13764  [mRNA]  locus=s370:10305:11661:+ [translate_table: standard]
MTPVISGQPPESMTSSVADAQRPLDRAPEKPVTLYSTVKESGEKVLKHWPGNRKDSQEAFRELVLEATRSILLNTVEFCKTSQVPSSGIKIVVENFVAATYDAYYACGKTLALSWGTSQTLKAARNDYAVQLFLALRVLDVEAKGYNQYLLPEPLLHQVQTPSWHMPFSGAIFVGLLSISVALAALFNRLQ